jgi:hypothetical protein
MKKSDQQLLEVVEIWPSLSTWEKYHLLLLALWWARVVHPIRSLITRTGLRDGNTKNTINKLLITLLVVTILVLAGLSVSINPSYSLYVLFLAFLCAILAISINT